MSGENRPKARKSRELKVKDLDYTVNYKPTGVKSSDDIQPCHKIIGQERAVNAIFTGLNVKCAGYNIFVTGLMGTGRTTTIKHILEELDQGEPELHDVCYLNNFKNEDCPRVVMFKAGDGSRFRRDMGYLVSSIRKAVPKIFLADDYKERQSRIVREFENRQKRLIQGFEERLTNDGFVMVQLQMADGNRNEIQPLIDGEPASLDKLEQLSKNGKFPESRLDELRRLWDSLRREFDVTSVESKKLTMKLEDALEKLDFSMLSPLIKDKVNLLKKRYPAEDLVTYLNDVYDALTNDLDRFKEAQPRRGEQSPPAFRKREPFEEFSVNLILDNSEKDKIPVVIEKSPSYKNIFGSLERVVDRFGYWSILTGHNRTPFDLLFDAKYIYH